MKLQTSALVTGDAELIARMNCAEGVDLVPADFHDDEVYRLGLVIAKLQAKIARKRRQQHGKDAALMRWRRWAEATFLGGERSGVTDKELMQRVSASLESGATVGAVDPVGELAKRGSAHARIGIYRCQTINGIRKDEEERCVARAYWSLIRDDRIYRAKISQLIRNTEFGG